MSATVRITTRNARFQIMESLLGNRNKRQRAGLFLVQGVRSIDQAVRHRWPLEAVAYDNSRPLSQWARDLLDEAHVERIAMSPDLIAVLGEKGDGETEADPDEAARHAVPGAEPSGSGSYGAGSSGAGSSGAGASRVPELVALARIPPDDLDRIATAAAHAYVRGERSTPEAFLGLAFDRPNSPGNLGSVIRSADAFGARGVIVTGHAADVYDPRCVRASTGSIFALPAVRCAAPREVRAWGDGLGEGRPVLVGADEHGSKQAFEVDFTRPVLLVIGNETTGLSKAWLEECDETVSIPMRGAATSLNAANAASILMYEATRQRAQAALQTAGR